MQVIKGLGSSSKINQVINNYDVAKILLVTGKNSFQISGIKQILDSCLKNYQVTHFNDFDVNPSIKDVKKGVDLAIENKIELIISVGGGSVLDMGKLIKALFMTPDITIDVARGLERIIDPHIPLIAIPTTAGSGSEATHFAVVYIESEKFSVADNSLLPDNVILDGDLIISASSYQKACNVLDAISQSIESAWAVASTIKSQTLSFKALKLCIKNYLSFVNSNKDKNVAQKMIEASNIAGQAINISKTTAAHAWSYSLTKKFSIPHGHAVWVTLPRIFELHFNATPFEVRDPRGIFHLKDIMNKLMNILMISPNERLDLYFEKFLNTINIKTDIVNDLKLSKRDRIFISNNVNKERLRNNPVCLNKSINKIFKIH